MLLASVWGTLRLISRSGKAFKRRPIATTALETSLGASAGAGGYLASAAFPESDTAKFIGEIAGGTVPAFMPINMAVRSSIRLRHMRGLKRARERAKRAVPPEKRAALVRQLKESTTRGPDGKPVLTPAQRTGDPGLLSLERAVVESNELLKRESDLQMAEANKAIQLATQDIGTSQAAAMDRHAGRITGIHAEAPRPADKKCCASIRPAN